LKLLFLLKLTSLLFLLVLLFAAGPRAFGFEGDWSVQATNSFEYCHLKENLAFRFLPQEAKEDSIRNRLIVDFLFGDFYAGVWYELAPTGIFSSSSFKEEAKLRQRYFGWHQNGLEIRGGHFNATFDRGLVLNAFFDDFANISRNIDGIRVHYTSDLFNSEVVGGEIFDEFSRDSLSIRGGRAALTPFGLFSVGGAYLRLWERNFLGEMKSTNVKQGNLDISFGPVDLYGEYARQGGYLSALLPIEGDGTYLSGSLYGPFFGVTAEYKNYIHMQIPGVNSPPAVNHFEKSLNGGWNEIGWRLAATLTPYSDWSLEVDWANSWMRGTGSIFDEQFVQVRGSYYRENVLRASYDRHKEHDHLEHWSDFSMYYYLTRRTTVSVSGLHKKYEDKFLKDYHEKDLTLGFSQARLFSISLTGGRSSELGQFRELPEKTASVELTVKFRNNDLTVFHGDQRGGLVCTSGVCVDQPAFRGTKVLLLSRF